ncbi:MAG: DUF86 domain-containing protein [Candidatus Aminicenantales bacterium]
MPRYDHDRLVRLVSHMRNSVAQLERLKANKKQAFLSDTDKVGSSKYHFIVAIEAAIDICNHIIFQNGYRAPEDYADTFSVLEEKGALDKAFAESLQEMAKFGNRLVHIYWEIDESQVHDILQSRLGDFKKFLDQIAVFLGWSGIN